MRRPGQGGRWFQLLALVVKPFLYAFTRRDWRGLENVPAQGGVIVVANHVTVVDPFTLAHAMYDGAGRIPRFLAKSEIFKVPVVGALLRKGGQIAVYRRTREAANSLRDAEKALGAGELLIIYPEGTCTRDPNGWPMVSKTGVARLALACDVPVVPVAHWGAHRILGYHSKRPQLFPPKLVQAMAGPPVDLSKYRDAEPTNDVLREVTDLLMTRVKELLAQLRGETPPDGFYVPTGGATASTPLSPEATPLSPDATPLSPDAAAQDDPDAAETGVA